MQHNRRVREDTYKDDGEVRRLLEEMRRLALDRQTSSEAEGQQPSRTTSINLSRNIQLAGDEVLDQEALVSLAQIYNADQKLADAISAGLHVACQPSSACPSRRRNSNSHSAETEKANNIRLNGTKSLARSAVREMLVQSTDDFASSLGLVDKTPVRVGQTETSLDVDFEMVLQEYAHVCTTPNDAELEMLSMALGVEKAVVTRWFLDRAHSTRRLFVVQQWPALLSELGAEIRKQQVQTQASSSLSPEIPQEIKDFI
ncbi:hypothetical protein MBLNU457_4173t2 [Dothideomycetes sp. NU457]